MVKMERSTDTPRGTNGPRAWSQTPRFDAYRAKNTDDANSTTETANAKEEPGMNMLTWKTYYDRRNRSSGLPGPAGRQFKQ